MRAVQASEPLAYHGSRISLAHQFALRSGTVHPVDPIIPPIESSLIDMSVTRRVAMRV
jgi:hypothetical protein